MPLDLIALALLGWLALSFLCAPILGRVIRGPKREDVDLGEFIEQRRQAEVRATAAARRARERREQNTRVDRRGRAA